MASAGSTTRRRALLHAAWTLIPFAALWVYHAREYERQAPNVAGLCHRLAWYREHRSEFDLLWLGDSRTYCAMDPVVHDPLLGRRSLNMAIWAMWFPEQWAFIEDLLPEVPRGTAICWSIGHQNFIRTPNVLGTQYPLGLSRVVRYMLFGYDWANVRGNLYHYAAALELPRRAAVWHDDIDRMLAMPCVEPPALPEAPDPPGLGALRERANALLAQVVADPTTLQAQILTDGGRPTSVEALTTLGSYRRFELDPDFFRRKQAEMVKARGPASGGASAAVEVFEPDPLLWATFERMLDLLAASGSKVIVNELEEAPHTYASDQAKDADRRFMRDRVRAAVEARGLVYVRADFDRLSDEDYFDYNHLNTTGTARYAVLLAEVLRPQLRRD
ncbi:MAG TPA: hypothetical protein VFZ65_05780 [Planctomycetota bacterium]|nr:hypothetical protein [Planctomycetota bacterium]